MKTPDEIKDNARTCISQPYTEPCGSCKLYPKCRGDVNYNLIALLDLVNEYERRLAQVERERDAAVKDCSRFPCATCSDKENGDLCHNCNVRKDTTRTNYEWRGVCEENTKEDAGENTEKV